MTKVKAKPQPMIYVMDRGWVLVGIPREENADVIVVDRCFVVRRWGTTKGIGELAVNGPLKDTILDFEADGVTLYHQAMHHIIPCVAEAWDLGEIPK